MTKEKRDTATLNHQLHDIQRLEDQLIQLKRQLLASGTTGSELAAVNDDGAGFLILRNRDRYFAIPVNQVEEVVEMVEVKSHHTHPGVLGLVNYHGELIAALDLGELAGMGKTKIETDNVLVICLMEKLRFAIMVPEATDVIASEARFIKAADEVMPGLLREVGLFQTADFTASIIDVWSTVLAAQVEAHPSPSEKDAPPEGSAP